MNGKEGIPMMAVGTDQFIDIDAYLRTRRDALLQELHAIEKALDIEPKVRAVCPSCQKEWNKRVAGEVHNG